MICKWATDCVHCGLQIEEGDDVFFAPFLDERVKICFLCARLEGIACECGNAKKQEHWKCWGCKREEDEADGLVCECGKYKKPQFEMCWTCKTAGAS